MGTIKFSYGLQSSYDSLDKKDENTIYFISDEKCIYFRNVKYARNEEEEIHNLLSGLVKEAEVIGGKLKVIKYNGTVMEYDILTDLVTSIDTENPSDKKAVSESAVVDLICWKDII